MRRKLEEAGRKDAKLKKQNEDLKAQIEEMKKQQPEANPDNLDAGLHGDDEKPDEKENGMNFNISMKNKQSNRQLSLCRRMWPNTRNMGLQNDPIGFKGFKN